MMRKRGREVTMKRRKYDEEEKKRRCE